MTQYDYKTAGKEAGLFNFGQFIRSHGYLENPSVGLLGYTRVKENVDLIFQGMEQKPDKDLTIINFERDSKRFKFLQEFYEGTTLTNSIVKSKEAFHVKGDIFNILTKKYFRPNLLYIDLESGFGTRDKKNNHVPSKTLKANLTKIALNALKTSSYCYVYLNAPRPARMPKIQDSQFLQDFDSFLNRNPYITDYKFQDYLGYRKGSKRTRATRMYGYFILFEKMAKS